MEKRRERIVIFFISATILILCAMAIYNTYMKTHSISEEPEKGRIDVIFQSNVSYDQALAVVESQNCTVVEHHTVNGRIVCHVQVPDNEEVEFKTIFEQEPNVWKVNLIYEEK